MQFRSGLILSTTVSLFTGLISGMPAMAIAYGDDPANLAAHTPGNRPENPGNGDGVRDPLEVLDGANVLQPMIERYTTDRRALGRSYPVPMSTRGADRMRAFIARWKFQLDAVNFDALPHIGKVDYLLFANLLDHETKALEHEAARIAAIKPLVPFAETIIKLGDDHQAMKTIGGREAADALASINEMIEAATEALDKEDEEVEGEEGAPIVSKIIADRAVRRIGDLRYTLGFWHNFYDGYDPMFSWWTKTPYEKVDAALEAYAALLRKKLVGIEMDDEETIIGDPIGAEALADELAFEMIPYTPQELIAIAAPRRSAAG